MTAGEVLDAGRPHDRCGCPSCCTFDNAKKAPSRDWPMYGDRMLCDPDRPMPRVHSGRWAHLLAVTTHAGDYTDDKRCPACGHEWTEELPE